MTAKGHSVTIDALAIEFYEGGNTLWVHGRDGGTVLRIKTMSGKITSKRCASPVPHADMEVEGDIEICVPSKRKR